MLCHLLHDERIADHTAHDFRCVESGLPAQNRAVIEFHKHHQPRPAQTFTNRDLKRSARGAQGFGSERLLKKATLQKKNMSLQSG